MTKSEWVQQALNRYERPLVRYAMRILGDVERSRDVVQDTFLSLCRQDPGRIGDHLAAWLYTVCRNRALDVRKKESAMQPLDDAQANLRPSTAPAPSILLERKETMGEILEILDSMPESQREVLLLKFESELSYKEISEITHLSVSNVGFIIHTVLKTIREKLKAQSPPTEKVLRRIK